MSNNLTIEYNFIDTKLRVKFKNMLLKNKTTFWLNDLKYNRNKTNNPNWLWTRICYKCFVNMVVGKMESPDRAFRCQIFIKRDAVI